MKKVEPIRPKSLEYYAIREPSTETARDIVQNFLNWINDDGYEAFVREWPIIILNYEFKPSAVELDGILNAVKTILEKEEGRRFRIRDIRGDYESASSSNDDGEGGGAPTHKGYAQRIQNSDEYIDKYIVDSHQFYRINPATSIYFPVDIKLFAYRDLHDLSGGHLGGEKCERKSDYDAIASIVHKTEFQLAGGDPFEKAPLGVAVGDQFLRATPQGLVPEKLGREHLCRYSWAVPEDWDWQSPMRTDTKLYEILKYGYGEWDDEDGQVKLLAQGLGAAITGTGGLLQRMFVIFGKPRNGKSTLLSFVERLLSPHGLSCVFNPYQLDDAYHLAKVSGAQLLIASELSTVKRRGDPLGEKFKEFIGGDKQQGRTIYESPFDFYNRAVAFGISNKGLAVSENDEAIWERLACIRHGGDPIESDKRDPMLVDKMVSCPIERGEFLKLALKGFNSMIAADGEKLSLKLSLTEQHKVEIGRLKARLDSPLGFVRDPEWCVLKEGAFVKQPRLYDEYLDWCVARDYQYVDKNAFYRRLKSTEVLGLTGIQDGTADGYKVFRNVGLAAEDEF